MLYDGLQWVEKEVEVNISRCLWIHTNIYKYLWKKSTWFTSLEGQICFSKNNLKATKFKMSINRYLWTGFFNCIAMDICNYVKKNSNQCKFLKCSASSFKNETFKIINMFRWFPLTQQIIKIWASLIVSDYYVSGLRPGSISNGPEFFICPKDIPEEYY